MPSPSRRLIAPLPRSRLSAAAQLPLTSSSSDVAPEAISLPPALLTAASVVSAAAEATTGERSAERAIEGIEGVAASGEMPEEQEGADVEMVEVEQKQRRKEERLSGSALASEAVEVAE